MTLTGLLARARPYRGRLALVSLFMLGESLASLAVPWLLGQLAGGVMAGTTGFGLVAALIALMAAVGGLRLAATLMSGGVSLRILADLRLLAHDHLQSLPLAFHQASRQGDLLALTTWEVSRLSAFLTGTLTSLLPLLVTAIGSVFLMARIDPVLALAVPLLVPVFYLILKVLGRRLRALSGRVQEAEAAAMATAQEHLDMLPAIKTFTREAPASADYRARVEQARALSLTELSAYAALSPAIQFTAGSAAVVLLVLAGRNVAAGTMTLADLVSFLLYAALLTRPVAALADVYGRTQAARGTLARLGRVLDTPPERGGAVALDRAKGAIDVQGLRFAYPDRPPALEGIDLHVGAGECVALTGPNGAGKTTLSALLMRLHDPDAGHILLDGQDIATLRLPDLRRQFGHVPQRPLLFNGSVRDNIAFGLPAATQAQVIAAAQSAQADGFIRDLPQGYDTMIGDHGVRLSGGQGQRVALARALIKDPAVLILDEATSMYDTEGESAFVAAAATAFRGRTVILITHRPATLALAARVLQLSGGRLA